jgi:hypothetical protein
MSIFLPIKGVLFPQLGDATHEYMELLFAPPIRIQKEEEMKIEEKKQEKRNEINQICGKRKSDDPNNLPKKKKPIVFEFGK